MFVLVAPLPLSFAPVGLCRIGGWSLVVVGVLSSVCVSGPSVVAFAARVVGRSVRAVARRADFASECRERERRGFLSLHERGRVGREDVLAGRLEHLQNLVDVEFLRREALVQWRKRVGCVRRQRDAAGAVDVAHAEHVEERRPLNPDGNRRSGRVPVVVADADEFAGERGDVVGLV